MTDDQANAQQTFDEVAVSSPTSVASSGWGLGNASQPLT